jgi:Flp pilus assembly protein TadG
MNPGSALLRRLWRVFRRDRRGNVVVEAALILPLMAIAIVASVDVARYLQMSARADRIAGSVADLVSRADVIRDRRLVDHLSRSTDLGVYFRMAGEMAQPEDLNAGGVVISSITGAAGRPVVNWMRSDGAQATTSATRLQAIPALPTGMPFVVAEVFLPFRPVILDRTALLGTIGFDRVIYRRALFRPRAATLTTLAPANS